MSGRIVPGYKPLLQQPFPCPVGLEATQGFTGGSFGTRVLISNGATRSYENDNEGWISIRRYRRTNVRGRR